MAIVSACGLLSFNRRFVELHSYLVYIRPSIVLFLVRFMIFHIMSR